MTHPVIGEAFVRVRPDFIGFQAQAQSQIQSSLGGVARQTERVGLGARNATRDVERFDRGIVAANASALGFGRSLAFASTAFLGGAGLGALIHAAVDEFKNMITTGATTNAILRATGGAAGIGAEGINRLAKQQERLTGADDELVKQAENVLLSFRRIRNEAGAGNDIFTRATKASSDLATVFGQDVPSAARQLGRALADPARGVVLLRRAGVVFTQDQIKLIKSLVRTGQVLQAQRLVLDQVEHSVGGTAAAVGRTLPGQLDILRERARDALGEYVKRLSESRQAAELAASGARGLGQTFAVIKGTVQAIGPPLIGAAQAAIKLAGAVGGVGPIIAAVAAYKAVGLAVGLAGAAQAAYARAVVIATGATTRESIAVAANAAAFRAQALSSAVSAGGVVATGISRGGVLLPASVGVDAERAAVGLTRVGFGARAAAIGLGASRLALAAVGGPLGAAALGAAGLTIALLRLNRAARSAPGTLTGLRGSLDELNNALSRNLALRQQLAARSENVSLGRFNVQAAQQGLSTAQANLARSTAAPGSLQQRFLLEQVTAAKQKLAAAERALATAEQNRDRIQARLNQNERDRQFVIANTTRELQNQFQTIIGQRANIVRGPLGEGLTFTRTPDAGEALAKLIKLTGQLSQSGDQVKRSVGGALFTIAETLNRLPTQKELTLVVRLAGEGQSTNDIVRRILGIGITGEFIRLRRIATQATGSVALKQEFQAQKKILGIEEKHLAKLRDIVQKRRDELQVTRDGIAAARDSLTTAKETQQSAIQNLQLARQSLVQAQQALTVTIQEARAATRQAVSDAKGNLDSLGQAIAAALGTGGRFLTGGRQGAEFRRLRDQILAGGGGPETQRLAQQLALRATNTQLPKEFADLTDRLDRGKISVREFNREFAVLLKGLDLKEFEREFGSAAANTLRDQIAALRRQARLIAGGPQIRGGVQQTIVRPLLTVAQGARDVAAAQRQVATSQRDISKAQLEIVRATRQVEAAQRRLSEAQTRETRANTKELKASTRAAIELARVLKTRAELTGKPKPKGDADKTAGALTTAGAQTP